MGKPDGGGEKKPSVTWRRRLFGLVVQTSAMAAGVAIAIHLTVQDRFAVFAPVFYAVPPTLVLLMAFPGLVLNAKAKARWRTVGCAATVVAAGTAIFLGGYRSGAATAAEAVEDSTRLVAWNLADAFWGVDTAAVGVEELQPAVAVLFEAPTPDESREVFGERFPGCSVVPLGDDGMLIVRGDIDDSYRKDFDHGTLSLFELDLDHVELDLAVVQFDSAPWIGRAEPLATIATALTEELGSPESRRRPLVVVGSFHMPRVSALLKREFAPLGLRESFLTAGSGLGTGWPTWLPLYDGEQFWASDDLEILRSSAQLTLRSDHLPWVLEFRPANDR